MKRLCYSTCKKLTDAKVVPHSQTHKHPTLHSQAKNTLHSRAKNTLHSRANKYSEKSEQARSCPIISRTNLQLQSHDRSVDILDGYIATILD